MSDRFDFACTADFHRHITEALALEWRLAADRLPDDLRANLREPGFALHSYSSYLGQWVGAPVREIRLQETLVKQHPWYALVDVLKHEMAHQLAEELFAPGDQTVHGAAFRESCRLLGANPAASGSFPTLDQLIFSEGACDRDRIMDRIRKLLALAESPNRHEAERAMAKARQLMARHHVTAAPSARQDYLTICLGGPRLRHGLDRHALAGLIRDACFVKTIWIPMAVPEKGKIGRALEVSGTREHAQMAHYVYDFVSRVIEAEWKRIRTGKSLGRNGRRDFALGVIDGFRKILDKQTDTSADIRALIRQGDPGLESYFTRRHPRTRHSKVGRKARVNAELIDQGKRTAQRVGFRPGIEATANKLGRRLGR